MKFVYQYRTSGNEVKRGEIAAPDRESAFQALKAQGIKPARLEEAPGIFNKLFGKGKRWIAIFGLLAALAAACFVILSMNDEMTYAFEERAQLFGDPFVLKKLSANGWRESFPDEGNAWFARHAIPGVTCDCDKEELRALRQGRAEPILGTEPIAIAKSDPDELAKMKRMINCMKREFARYMEAGGSEAQYRIECETRLSVEHQIFERVSSALKSLEKKLTPENHPQIEKAWDGKNELLRSMGLMTIPMPE